jgi:vitamin B12/bleomycin/antimicrobial peptide transport system ATP-binding/permease protein
VNGLNKDVWKRFWRIAKPFWVSNDKKAALGLLAVVLLLIAAVNGLNVGINYIGGAFMTALSEKNQPEFWKMLWIYAAVFVVGTPIVAFSGWAKDKLALRWRQWLTTHLLDKYLRNRNFYKINHNSDIDNPDERLHQDITSFTSTALALFVALLSAVITLVSFAGILWSISKPLCAVLILYSVGGTIATVCYGKRLIGLNFNQLRKEADFRYSLVHVRKNVESIAFYQGEEQEGFQIKRRFLDAMSNFNALIGWQRNLSFLTTGYNYMVVIIPSLVIAPLYFAGQVKMGVISQADMAFAQVLASLSIIVTSFETLSSFVAVTNRLGTFVEALDEAPETTTVVRTKTAPGVQLDKLTVTTPDLRQTLVSDLSVDSKTAQSLLIVGASGIGKSSVLRTIAGLWNSGDGSVERPELKDMLFLPQKPYMSLGTLRQQMLYPHVDTQVTDEELSAILQKVELGDLPAKVGGFETELDWSEFLSVGEQQRLAFARILVHKPSYAVLDEATSGLDVANEERLYRELQSSGTNFISVGHRTTLTAYHENVLEITPGGSWKVVPAKDYAQKTFPQFFDAPVADALPSV